MLGCACICCMGSAARLSLWHVAGTAWQPRRQHSHFYYIVSILRLTRPWWILERPAQQMQSSLQLRPFCFVLGHEMNEEICLCMLLLSYLRQLLPARSTNQQLIVFSTVACVALPD
jgi:hypothetical protein